MDAAEPEISKPLAYITNNAPGSLTVHYDFCVCYLVAAIVASS